jgi:hypothetical protein
MYMTRKSDARNAKESRYEENKKSKTPPCHRENAECAFADV